MNVDSQPAPSSTPIVSSQSKSQPETSSLSPVRSLSLPLPSTPPSPSGWFPPGFNANSGSSSLPSLTSSSSPSSTPVHVPYRQPDLSGKQRAPKRGNVKLVKPTSEMPGLGPKLFAIVALALPRTTDEGYAHCCSHSFLHQYRILAL
jgi:hypothetical protein